MQAPTDIPGIIFIDIYTTQPQHQMKVAEILSQVLVDTRALYGDSYGRWLAGSIHQSVDGTRVIVYEHFSDRRAAEHIHGARHSQPAEHALNRLATRDRHLYTLFPFEEYAKPPRE